MQRGVEQTEQGDQAGGPRAQVAAREAVQRQRRASDQDRLKHQQRLGTRRQPVGEGDQIRDVRLVIPEVRRVRVADHRRLEQRERSSAPRSTPGCSRCPGRSRPSAGCSGSGSSGSRRRARGGARRSPTIASGSQGIRASAAAALGAEGVDARPRARRQQRRRGQRDAHQRLQRQPEGRRQHGERQLARAGPQLPVKQQRHERGQAQRRQPAGRALDGIQAGGPPPEPDGQRRRRRPPARPRPARRGPACAAPGAARWCRRSGASGARAAGTRARAPPTRPPPPAGRARGRRASAEARAGLCSGRPRHLGAAVYNSGRDGI